MNATLSLNDSGIDDEGGDCMQAQIHSIRAKRAREGSRPSVRFWTFTVTEDSMAWDTNSLSKVQVPAGEVVKVLKQLRELSRQPLYVLLHEPVMAKSSIIPMDHFIESCERYKVFTEYDDML